MVGRNKTYDYERREGNKISGLDIPWAREIVSADGANYHCWIPTGITVEEEHTLYQLFKSAARNYGDPVSFSWDYIPREAYDTKEM